jgi:hypothetical protein
VAFSLSIGKKSITGTRTSTMGTEWIGQVRVSGH